ncbi:protein PFC0760c-like [Chelonus insularis]|uniref:protein PFC0760c-like n=1 Tax=Chelonus insularis TaxID=460826 RepID=UPI00158A220D|nr:protein PFC0760c-like [Chelonus insularis]
MTPSLRNKSNKLKQTKKCDSKMKSSNIKSEKTPNNQTTKKNNDARDLKPERKRLNDSSGDKNITKKQKIDESVLRAQVELLKHVQPLLKESANKENVNENNIIENVSKPCITQSSVINKLLHLQKQNRLLKNQNKRLLDIIYHSESIRQMSKKTAQIKFILQNFNKKIKRTITNDKSQPTRDNITSRNAKKLIKINDHERNSGFVIETSDDRRNSSNNNDLCNTANSDNTNENEKVENNPASNINELGDEPQDESFDEKKIVITDGAVLNNTLQKLLPENETVDFINFGGTLIARKTLNNCCVSKPSKLVTDLMTVIFSVEEMAESSLSGEIPNIHKNRATDEIRKKKKLDFKRVDAIIEYVQGKFPDATREKIKSTIQGKLKYESHKKFGVNFKVPKKEKNDS